MNKIVILGRLVDDVNLKFTQNKGMAVSRFTVAVDRKYLNSKGERETDFIPVVAFGKAAENYANHLVKGQSVAIAGTLQINNYKNKNDEYKQFTQIIAEEVKFLSKPKGLKDNEIIQDAGSFIPNDVPE